MNETKSVKLLLQYLVRVCRDYSLVISLLLVLDPFEDLLNDPSSES